MVHIYDCTVRVIQWGLQANISFNLDELITPSLQPSLDEIQTHLKIITPEILFKILHCVGHMNPWSIIDLIQPRKLKVRIKVVNLHHAEPGSCLVWIGPIMPCVGLLKIFPKL